VPNTRKIAPGTKVVLSRVPDSLLSGLPEEDQDAIREVIGKPVLLDEYDEDGRAVLRFIDASKTIHYIFVEPDLIQESKENIPIADR
jgi:hypothetical protein